MDIRNWPMDRIMQLPDSAFGQKFPICVSSLGIELAPAWDISELGMPEVCVLWSLTLQSWSNSTNLMYYRLALGDQLPTAAAQVDILDPLIPGMGAQGGAPRRVVIHTSPMAITVPMRKLIPAMGRRIVLEVVSEAFKLVWVNVIAVVSSVPKEVPDCLLSV